MVKDILRSLFSSKKFLVLLAGLLTFVASRLGWGLSESDVMPALLLIGTYLGAQGLADFGKERAKVEGAYLLERVREMEAAPAPKPAARGKK